MKKVILVLEDDKDTMQVTSTVFQQEGYKVIEAASVPEAITTVRTQHIDLAVIDIKMPIIDGYEFCKFLRRGEKYSHIPIMIVTGEEKRYGKETAQMLKIEEFVEKPYDPKTLAEKAKKILGLPGEKYK